MELKKNRCTSKCCVLPGGHIRFFYASGGSWERLTQFHPGLSVLGKKIMHKRLCLQKIHESLQKKKKLMHSSPGAISEERGGRVSCDVTVNQHFPFHLLAPMQHINIQGPGGEQPEGQRSRGERPDRQRTRRPEGTLR